MQNKIAIPIIIILSIVVIGFILHLNTDRCDAIKDKLDSAIQEHLITRTNECFGCTNYTNKIADIQNQDIILPEKYSIMVPVYMANKKNNDTTKAFATISSKSNDVDCIFAGTGETKSDTYNIKPNRFINEKIIINTKEYKEEKQFCEITINVGKEKEKFRVDIRVFADKMKDKYYCF